MSLTALNLTATPTTMKVKQSFVRRGRLAANGQGVAEALVRWNGLEWVGTGVTAKTDGTYQCLLTGHEPNAGTYDLLTKYLWSATYAPSNAVKDATVVVTAS